MSLVTAINALARAADRISSVTRRKADSVSRGDSDDLNRQVGRLLLEESQLLCALARTLAKVDARSAADLASAAHRLATAARGLLEVEHGQGSAIHPNPKLTSPKRALHAVESDRVNTSEEENAG